MNARDTLIALTKNWLLFVKAKATCNCEILSHTSGAPELPSQVKANTIKFSTVEDTRPEYEGYAVTTMSWQKPEGKAWH